MPKRIYLFFGLLILLSSQACTPNKGKNIPDVSHIEVELEIQRFEKDLFALDTNQLAEELPGLREKYPQLTEFYFPILLGMQDTPLDSPEFPEKLKGFLSWPQARALYDTCMQVYPDLTALKEKLEEGFRFFKYYFPERDIPKVYTVITEYLGAVILTPNENAVLIGLDMFLGPDFPVYYYHPLNLPRYITRSLKPEAIPARVFEGMADDMVGDPPGNRLLDEMIRNGKKMYLLDCFQPRMPDSLKWGFTQAQMDWCYANEMEMWQYFISQELLYETDYQKIRKFISQSPSSPGMPAEAPGRTGNFMGYRIIQQFMKKNPEVSLQQLLEMKDTQLILDKARYRPG
jgi:hypothetical protein